MGRIVIHDAEDIWEAVAEAARDARWRSIWKIRQQLDAFRQSREIEQSVEERSDGTVIHYEGGLSENHYG